MVRFQVSCIVLPVEIQASTGISDAYYDAVDLAARLGCMVTFDFNGIHCMAMPRSTVSVLVSEFHQQLNKQYGRRINPLIDDTG